MSTLTSFLTGSILCCLSMHVLSICYANSQNPIVICVNQTSIIGSCHVTFVKLQDALEYARNFSSSVTVSIYKGTYILTSNIRIACVTQFDIEGEHADPVIIECEPDAGISFINSRNVSIQNLQFEGCGVRHKIGNSRSIFASLLFFKCSSVIMDDVKVINGIGVGTIFYATDGSNVIRSSHFENNNAPNDNSSYYGGGLHIGYPRRLFGYLSNHCLPVPFNTSSTIYNITNNTFMNNSAVNPYVPLQENLLSSNPSNYSEQCGGGLTIFFLGNASLSNNIYIHNCTFMGNQAKYGGGVYVRFSDTSENNTIQFLHTNFHNNFAWYEGGGVRLDYHSVDVDYGNNSCLFQMCEFQKNNASVGGGVSISTSKQAELESIFFFKFLNFSECSWLYNSALVGSAINGNLKYPLNSGVALAIVLSDCNFTKNNASQHEQPGQLAGLSTVSLDSVPLQIVSSVHFHDNDGTCIFAINSKVSFLNGSTSTFENNVASRGAVFLMLASAFIEVYPNTTFYFTGNRVSNYGAVLYGYTLSPNDFISLETSSQNCVLRYSDPDVHPADWEAEFHFLNNTGKESIPDSIYLTSLMPCVSNNASENKTELFHQVFCWSNKWDYGGDSCVNQVKSAPSQLMIDSTLSSTAGEITFLNATAYDDQRENITKDLILTVNSKPEDNIHISGSYHFISNNQIEVDQHTLDDTEKSFHFMSEFPRILQANVKVKMLPCPLGYELNGDGSCECKSYHNYIQCHPTYWNASIRRSYWIGTYNNQSTAGYCVLCHNGSKYTPGDYIAIPVSDNDSYTYQCANNREKVLCSKCKSNYGVSATADDFRCVSCSNSSSGYFWLLYFLCNYVPSTIMIVILFITNFSLASGPLNAAIFFAQMITTAMDVTQDGVIPIESDVSTIPDALLIIYKVVYGIWSLDFFKPFLADFCLSRNLTTIDVIALRYSGAFFPMLFIFAILTLRYLDNMNATLIVKMKKCLFLVHPLKQCIRKFSNRGTLAVSSSLRNVVASCIILIYTRCVIVTAQLLRYAPLRFGNGTFVANFPVYDASTEYLKDGHKYYFVLGLVMIFTFLLPIPLTLILFRYDESRKKEGYFSIFLESFQREFKCANTKHSCPSLGSGLERSFLVASTSPDTPPSSFWKKHSCCNPFDYRWMAGVYFVLRSFMVLSILAPSRILVLFCQQVLCSAMAMIIILAQPYKNNWNNKLDCCILLLMVVINGINIHQYFLTLIGHRPSVPAFSVQYVLIYIPCLWISMYVIAIVLQACAEKRHRSRNNSETTTTTILNDPVGSVGGVADEEQASLKQAGMFLDVSMHDSRPLHTCSTRDSELTPLLDPDATNSDSSND